MLVSVVGREQVLNLVIRAFSNEPDLLSTTTALVFQTFLLVAAILAVRESSPRAALGLGFRFILLALALLLRLAL